MFSWLKRKVPDPKKVLPPFVTELFSSFALVTAIAENRSELLKAVANGSTSLPARQRKVEDPRRNVRDIWEDTRLECLDSFFSYGKADLMTLCEMRMQPSVFSSVVEERYLEFPMRPNGDAIHDSVQAIFQTFCYLSEAVMKAGAWPRPKPYSEAFLKTCSEGNSKWLAFDHQSRMRQSVGGAGIHSAVPPGPVMMSLFWKEVTSRTKEIAVCQSGGLIRTKLSSAASRISRSAAWSLVRSRRCFAGSID